MCIRDSTDPVARRRSVVTSTGSPIVCPYCRSCSLAKLSATLLTMSSALAGKATVTECSWPAYRTSSDRARVTLRSPNPSPASCARASRSISP